MSYQPRRAPRHATILLRGLPHRLTRWGPDAAAPLVCLHGWLDCSDTFQFVVDAFERDHPIVALDWRGFGHSAWQNGPYWFPDYLADLDALLEELSPERPATLVGHSMGGNIACLYAGVRPERVARVVNLEGFGLARTRAEQAPQRYRRWLEELRVPPAFASYESPERFAALLARRNPRLTPERAGFIAARWSRPLPGGACTVNADPAHKLVNPVLYRREEAEAVWRCAVAPTLLLLGGQSEFRARLGADGSDEYFAAIFPNLSIATVPGAGHMLHHEEPETVARLIEAFLAGSP